MVAVVKKWMMMAAMIGCLVGAPLQAQASLVADGNGNNRVEEPDPIPDPVPDPLPIPGEIIEFFTAWGYGDFSWGAIATEMVTAPSFGFPKAGIKIACSRRHH